MHILQHHIVSLPSSVCGSEEGRRLCCRGECRLEGNVLVFSDTVRWDTFFNVFPVRFWQQHTNLGDVRLQAIVRGQGKLLVWGLRHDGATVALHEEHFARQSPRSLTCVLRVDEGCLYYFMEIVPERGVVSLHGAVWGTVSPILQEPRIALVICAYRRKVRLRENLEQVFRYARRHLSTLDILVVDNGGDLVPSDLLPAGHVRLREAPHLFTNPCNLGGAGGFARGVHEAVRRGRYTHILLMDDDISLHSEMLHRLVRLLQHAAQPETLAVSGVLLDRERPSLVVEWGARYPGHPEAIAAGRDISRREQLTPPAEDAEYGAWTFFCYPLTPGTAKELPLPLFVRGDDAEFGLRLGGQHNMRIAAPASLFVWHHAFAQNSPIMLYHTLRNELIINELHKKFTCGVLLRYLSIPLYYILKRKYYKANITLMAFQAFLSGSGELLSLEYENKYIFSIEQQFNKERSGACVFFIKYVQCCITMMLYYISGLSIYKKLSKSSLLVWNKYFA